VLKHGTIALMLSAAALVMPLASCAGGARIYDPYRQDYHRWSPDEDRLYLRWEITTHRNHLEFHRRSFGDQRAYWGWRHR